MNEAAELHEETKDLKASIEALEFLSSVELKDVDRCLFVDSMVTASETGKELGEFCVSVQKASYNNEACYLVHANSHGTIDNILCGTSIVGFVSEASNLLILRILAQRKKVPENLTFLSFDTDTQIGLSTYRALEVKKQEIGKEMVEVFGIERTVYSAEKIPATWHCYFLPDGHLASRVQVGSSVIMNLLQLPPITTKDKRDCKSICEKKPLIWEEDIELYSKFLERKEELKADHSSYVRQHPELKALLADFLQMLLLRKPQDVFWFARDFFVPFNTQRPSDSTFNTSQNIPATEDSTS
ncbi:Ciliogenesis-associated TTC17-interacting protein [Bagarius yarrelli]|uniref:Ciliogenesis-associated TTC17-interacting protein n=1 Tax=Bagarius yarrelli TaxID=175774 RepID=A0A556TTA6_BAGYA|nr:Ciliogenesis-associated TTC17-interacting protein [Bagarius yarrelli]